MEEREESEQEGPLPEGAPFLVSLKEIEVAVEGEEKARGLGVEVEREEEEGGEEEQRGEGPLQGKGRAAPEEGEKGEEQEEEEVETEGEDRPEYPREAFDQQIPRNQEEGRAGRVEGYHLTLRQRRAGGSWESSSAKAAWLWGNQGSGGRGVLLRVVVVPQVQIASSTRDWAMRT